MSHTGSALGDQRQVLLDGESRVGTEVFHFIEVLLSEGNETGEVFHTVDDFVD